MNYFFIVFCIFLLYNFSFLIYGFSWLPDIVTRLNLNDSLLNTYHFLWVTALYLSPFYFILFTLFFYFTYPYLNLYYATISSIFYLLYSTEVLDFLVFNFQELTGNNILLSVPNEDGRISYITANLIPNYLRWWYLITKVGAYIISIEIPD